MTEAFAPKDGRQARWRYAYDLVVSLSPGDSITFVDLGALLDLDHHRRDDRQIMRAAMLEAKSKLERDRQQTVRTVQKFGWIVCGPDDNVGEIQVRRRKTARANDRRVRLINGTDRARLSKEKVQDFDWEQRSALATQALYSRKSPTFAELERRSRRKELPG